MSICKRCGADLGDQSRFCPACGLKADWKHDQYQTHGGGYKNETNYDYSDSFNPRDIEDNRIISCLCYFGPLLLIPLLARPYSEYVKYHANQGILLFIACMITGGVGAIPILGWIASFVGGILCMICLILGIVNSLNGRAAPLPFIGSFVILR